MIKPKAADGVRYLLLGAGGVGKSTVSCLAASYCLVIFLIKISAQVQTQAELNFKQRFTLEELALAKDRIIFNVTAAVDAFLQVLAPLQLQLSTEAVVARDAFAILYDLFRVDGFSRAQTALGPIWNSIVTLW